MQIAVQAKTGKRTRLAVLGGTIGIGSLVLGACASAPDEVNEIFANMGAEITEPAVNLHRFDGLNVYEANATVSGNPESVAEQINDQLLVIGVATECTDSPRDFPFEVPLQNEVPDLECVLSSDLGWYYLSADGDSTHVTAFYN